jgi:hypothetical protein
MNRPWEPLHSVRWDNGLARPARDQLRQRSACLASLLAARIERCELLTLGRAIRADPLRIFLGGLMRNSTGRNVSRHFSAEDEPAWGLEEC